jgi:hypothetical protein
MNQIRIEPKGSAFSVQLVENGGKTQEMDVRVTYTDAENFAFYLAVRLHLDVYYLGKKVDRR